MFNATADTPDGIALTVPSGADTLAPTTCNSMRWLAAMGRAPRDSPRTVNPGEGRPF